MKLLELGRLPLYKDGFALTNASTGLEWLPPSKAFAVRGVRPALVAGYNHASSASTLTLQLRVTETTNYTFEEQLGRLRTALYADTTNDGGRGTFSLYSCTAPGVYKWYLPVCALSSTVDIDRFSGHKEALVTFTVTSSHQVWQSAEYTTIDLQPNATLYLDFDGGPAPISEFQAIFAVADPGTVRLYDGATGTNLAINHGLGANPYLDGVTQYYYRYDSITDSAGYVTTMTSWATSYLTSYSELTPYITNPFPGFAITPRTSTGSMSLRVNAAQACKVRFRAQRGIEL